MKKERNLISSLTKDNNKLLYQSQKKEKKENPMAKGPKREKVVKRIAQKEKELKIIRDILKKNAH